MKLGRAAWLPSAIALAGSAILVYWTSTARPLWVDEEMLLLNVRDRGFLRLAGPLWLDQSAPLGWLVLERIILLILGPSEPAVRLLTVVFGIAMLATAVWIGRRWMSAPAAAVFVALCALGEWPVFFTLELKHYSADMFGALLVPALAGWVLDARMRPVDLRARLRTWWIVAAVVQWFSNGALFVTPMCAGILAVVILRTTDAAPVAPGGQRSVRLPARTTMLAGSFIWLVSFGANYPLVLRPASRNLYLRTYWAFAFPPVSHGVGATLAWIIGQLEPFARKPASSGMPVLFWLVWTAGVAFAIARHRRHALFVATVPFAAVALALTHVVPPFERLALWVVPSMYAGIGYGVDAALAVARVSFVRTRPVRIGTAVASVAIVLAVSGDVMWRGLNALVHRPHSNYGLDDRSSIHWLLSNHRTGDAVLATHFGLAALWWYGRIPVSGPAGGGRLPDGSPIFEVGHIPPGRACREWDRRDDAALSGNTRAGLYLGFRMNVEPVGFDNLALNELGRRGRLDAYREYAEESRLAVFDFAGPPRTPVVTPRQEERFPLTARGCMAVRPAARW